jgi:hypothetical protein
VASSLGATGAIGALLVFINMTLVMRKDYINNKKFARAQIIYHCSTSPRSITGIVIYILPQGRSGMDRY